MTNNSTIFAGIASGILGGHPSHQEMLTQTTIDKALTGRLELVFAQKTLLGKYFRLLSDTGQKRLLDQVNIEIGHMPPWMCRNWPNYKSLHKQFVFLFLEDFVDDASDAYGDGEDLEDVEDDFDDNDDDDSRNPTYSPKVDS
jgi:hypothetical protein